MSILDTRPVTADTWHDALQVLADITRAATNSGITLTAANVAPHPQSGRFTVALTAPLLDTRRLVAELRMEPLTEFSGPDHQVWAVVIDGVTITAFTLGGAL